MKEFVVYTTLRLLLLAATFGIVAGVWLLIAGHANILVSIIIAFAVSGLGSWFLLQRPRAAFAERVEARADRAVTAFEALRAKEDAEVEAAAAAEAEAAAAADADQHR